MPLAAASASFRTRFEDKSLDLPSLFMELVPVGVPFLEIASAHFANLSPAYLDQLRTQSLATRITLRSLDIRSDFAFPDPDERTRQLRDLTTWIDLARQLDIPLLHLHTGVLRPDLSPQLARSWTRHALEHLLPQAASTGRLLALQDDAHLFPDPASLLTELQSPALALSFDIRSLADLPDDLPLAILRVPFADDPRELDTLARNLIARRFPSPPLIVLHYTGSLDPANALSRFVSRLA